MTGDVTSLLPRARRVRRAISVASPAILVITLVLAGCISPADAPTAIQAASLTGSGSEDDSVLWVRGVEQGGQIYGSMGPSEHWGVGRFQASTGALTKEIVWLDGSVEVLDLSDGAVMASTWPTVPLGDVIDSDEVARIAREAFQVDRIEEHWSLNYWLYATENGAEWFVSLTFDKGEAMGLPDPPQRKVLVLDARTGARLDESQLRGMTFETAVDAALAAWPGDVVHVVEAHLRESDHWVPSPVGHGAQFREPPQFPDARWGDAIGTLWYLMLREESSGAIIHVFVRGDGETLRTSAIDVDQWLWAEEDPYVGLSANEIKSPHEVLPLVESSSGRGVTYDLFWPNDEPTWAVNEIAEWAGGRLAQGNAAR